MAMIAAEELECAGVSLAVPVLYLVEAARGFVFDQHATTELRSGILPKVRAGEAFPGIITTEQEGVSDTVGACQTSAVRDGDEWVLNGESMFCNGVRESSDEERPVETGIRGIRSYSVGAGGTMNRMRLVIARELLGAECQAVQAVGPLNLGGIS